MRTAPWSQSAKELSSRRRRSCNLAPVMCVDEAAQEPSRKATARARILNRKKEKDPKECGEEFLWSVVLAVATLAWASASSYLSSQALANTRSDLHATLRLLHFRRSLLPRHPHPGLSA